MTKFTATTFKQGEIWVARVVFMINGTPQFKPRPVVIVNNEWALDIDVIVAPVSSQRARNQFDIPLIHWKEAGLTKESIVRTSKPLTIHGNELSKKVGDLHPVDLSRVIEQCKKIF